MAAAELAQAYPFDTVIGSLHVMPNNVDFYDMDYDHLDQDALLRDYLAEAKKMIEFGGFDVFAHLDYPLRVMKRDNNQPSFENFMEWVTPVLRALIDRELAGFDREGMHERLQAQLARKVRTMRQAAPRELKAKLIRYGLSLGYDYGTVIETVSTMIEDNEPCEPF